MKEFSIGKNEAGQRFDKYLAKLLPKAPKSFIYKMLRKKNITLNGKKAAGNELLAVSDTVKLFLSDTTFDSFAGNISGEQDAAPKRPSFDFASCVIYEDSDIIVANKPAGVLSQPDGSDVASLTDALIEYLLSGGKITPGELRTFRPAPVNRLDRNTTGLILCGTSLKGAQFLSEVIRSGDIQKHYLTVAHGPIRDGLYTAYLKKEDNNKVRVIREAADGFAEILTGVKVLDRAGQYSLLDIDLITGKTHQIRSHLAFLGAPVIGDIKYGDRELCRKLKNSCGLKYQFLHAERLTFPGTDGDFSYLSGRTFKAPLTSGEKRILEELGLHIPQNQKEETKST